MEGGVLASRYQLLSKLGEGSTGTVWRALDLELERRLAVKIVDAKYVDTPELATRFLREVKAAARLSGTNVAPVYDCGTDEGTAYVAMELLEGESLAERLRNSGPLSPEATATLFVEIARGVSKAHSLGIIHANLKPSNVFLVWDDPTERAVILDFGVARGLGMDLEGYGGPNTRVGQLMGTPSYLSSEQVSGRGGVDYRSDIWSLAVIAFECLTGRRPFEDKTMGGLLLSICTEPPAVPSQIASVPAGFDEWFARGVDRDPERRFQSATEASDELSRICLSAAAPAPAVSSIAPSAAAVAGSSQADPYQDRQGWSDQQDWQGEPGEDEQNYEGQTQDEEDEAYDQELPGPSVVIDVDTERASAPPAIPVHRSVRPVSRTPRPRVVEEDSDAIVARIPKRIVYIAGAAAIVLLLVGVLVASGGSDSDRESGSGDTLAAEAEDQKPSQRTETAPSGTEAASASAQASPAPAAQGAQVTPTPQQQAATPAAAAPATGVVRPAPVFRQPRPATRPRASVPKKGTSSSSAASSRLKNDLGI